MTGSATNLTITITIASAGRTSLQRTLASLAAMERPAGVSLDVVIADDSAEGRVAGLVSDCGELPFAVQVVHVAAHNVSTARNACLDAATGELLAMVDDDEWVATDWLVRMLAALRDFNADCVFGPVHPVYPAGTPAWIVAANPLHVDWGKRGRRVLVGRSGNTLVRRAMIGRAGARFDSSLGRTGGEDTLFFHTLARAGAVMVVTDDAMVREDAPPARVNVRYFRHRATRTGQIYGRFVIASEALGPLGQARFYCAALVKATAGLGIAAALWPFDRAKALPFAMRGWMNAGKLRELLRLEPPQMI
jgi:succinoglycan biosynthesis protein ExoM